MGRARHRSVPLAAPMKLPIPKLNKELLILADCHGHFTAAIARREGKSWNILARESTPASLADLLAALHRKRRIPAQALLVTTACRPSLLALEITPSLSPEEVAELLRWEIEESLRDAPPLPEEAASDVGDTSRRSSHAASSGGYTFTAAIHEDSAARWISELAAQGILLAGIFPWLGTALPVVEDGRPLTLWQHTGSHLALFALRRGVLEFCGSCVANRENFRTSLARDARSLEPARTIIITHGETEAEFHEWLAEEKLAAAESLPPPLDADWPFLGAIAAVSSHTLLPPINLLPVPPPLWSRPVTWWAAAAVVFIIAVLPLPLQWQARFADLARQSERITSEVKSVESKIQEIRISTDEFAALKARHESIEEEIFRSRRSGVLPADSGFAQPEYISTLLRAVAEGCASRAKLAHFTGDYEGKLILKGTAPDDSAAQNAFSVIFSRLEKNKNFRPVPLTTRCRESGAYGIQFEASEGATSATFDAIPAPAATGP